MVKGVALFEYLSVPAPDLPRDTTRITEADGDTYDDDQGLGRLAYPSRSDSTIKTTRDGETYDDDVGALGLGKQGEAFGVATYSTRVDGESYDEDGSLQSLSSAHRFHETRLTKVDGETYDDQGLGLRAHPQH